nr:hypothetical protein [Cytophagales bacterium]
MDSGTIFYIIAVVIYFIYTALQQRKANKIPEADDQPSDPSPPSRGSFDDLLKEIRRQQEERERDIVISGEKAKPVEKPSYVEDYIEEKEVESRPAYVPNESTYKDPYRSLSQSQPLVKLDDQVDIHEDVKILGKVGSIDEKQSVNRYATLLKNPKSLREAIVVSEILNRRHF